MRAKDLTLEEKFKLLTGKDCWQTEDFNGKLPAVFVADGPHGLRKVEDTSVQSGNTTHKNTAYPTLSFLANTWNRNLANLMGSSIADDCIENKVDILLAPGVNIKRIPVNGRNFEYFSEDPYLAGELAYEYISGVQSKGIGTSLKHFALNSSEKYRHWENSEVDIRTFYDVYIPAFKRALEADPWTVMCSYNPVNGIYASENKKLLKGVLRDKLGYKGLIVSDWEAVKNRARALKATLDLEMPYNKNSFDELKRGFDCGYITEEEVDESVNRILDLIEKSEKAKKIRKTSFTEKERHENALKIAREGIVLLKNSGVLPLKKGAKIDLVGETGLRIGGCGSSAVQPAITVKTLEECLSEKGYIANRKYNPKFFTEGEYQIVSCYASSHESEGGDREDIKLNSIDEEMVIRLSNQGKKVIAVIYAGSAVDLSKIEGKAEAIILAGFGGEAINEALSDIISGEVSPSGKLSESFPSGDYVNPLEEGRKICLSSFYKERYCFGYRYYDRAEEKPLYPFGYGLSYAKFEYANLKLKMKDEVSCDVEFTVKNLSKVDGSEIAEVYVRDEVSLADRPFKELKGFEKVFLKAGESKKVKLTLPRSAFSYYNPSAEDYLVESGTFEILVGASSQDIRLSGKVEIELPEFKRYAVVFERN